jgi:hypothetical protein
MKRAASATNVFDAWAMTLVVITSSTGIVAGSVPCRCGRLPHYPVDPAARFRLVG